MSRQEFMNRLKRALADLPESERQELLADYEEHFDIGLAEGLTADQISEKLGNPAQIGRSASMEALLGTEQSGSRARKVGRALFASTSLGFFNVLFIIGPYAGLVAAMLGLWSGAAALALSGLAAIVMLVIGQVFPALIATDGLNWLLVIFAGIGTSALGVLACVGMWKLSQLFLGMTRRYVLFNVRLAKGAGK